MADAICDAVLFDRDGTLIEDVPNGVVTNQSGLPRHRFTAADLARVNARVERLLGPFDTWHVCPHDPTAGCACRVVVGDIGADGNRRVGCTLVVRADSAGDVLLAGPAIRAVRAGSRRVVFLCGRRGRAAAEPLPWIDPQPQQVSRADAACRHTRATDCPDPRHPCLSGVTPEQMTEALALLELR